MRRLIPIRIPTRPLLLSGVAAGVLFPPAVLAQALTRQGFDLSVHPLRLLSLGGAGWVQIFEDWIANAGAGPLAESLEQYAACCWIRLSWCWHSRSSTTPPWLRS